MLTSGSINVVMSCNPVVITSLSRVSQVTTGLKVEFQARCNYPGPPDYYSHTN